MAYNSAYAWTQNPTMRGVSALNPRTMLMAVPNTIVYVPFEELFLGNSSSVQPPSAEDDILVIVEIPIVIDEEFVNPDPPDNSAVPTQIEITVAVTLDTDAALLVGVSDTPEGYTQAQLDQINEWYWERLNPEPPPLTFTHEMQGGGISHSYISRSIGTLSVAMKESHKVQPISPLTISVKQFKFDNRPSTIYIPKNAVIAINWTPTIPRFNMSIAPEYVLGSDRIQIPLTLNYSGEPLEFRVVVWFNSAKLSLKTVDWQNPKVIATKLSEPGGWHYAQWSSGLSGGAYSWGTITTPPLGYDDGVVINFLNYQDAVSLMTAHSHMVATVNLVTVPGVRAYSVTTDDILVQLSQWNQANVDNYSIQEYTSWKAPSEPYVFSVIPTSSQVNSSTVEVDLAMYSQSDDDYVEFMSIMMFYNSADTTLNFTGFDGASRTFFVSEASVAPGKIPARFDSGIELTYNFTTAELDKNIGKFIFEIVDTSVRVSISPIRSFPFEIYVDRYRMEGGGGDIVCVPPQFVPIEWTATIPDELLVHFDPTEDTTFQYTKSDKKVTHLSDIAVGSAFTIVGEPKLYPRDARNGHRFVSFHDGGVSIGGLSINSIYGGSGGPIRGIMYTLFTTTGYSVGDLTVMGYDESDYTSGNWGIGNYQTGGALVTKFGQRASHPSYEEIQTITWNEAAYTNFYIAVSQVIEDESGKCDVTTELHRYAFTAEAGKGRNTGVFTPNMTPERKPYRARNTTMANRDDPTFLIGLRAISPGSEGYSKLKIAYGQYIKTEGHDEAKRLEVVNGIIDNFNTLKGRTGIQFKHPDGREWKWDDRWDMGTMSASNRFRLNTGITQRLDMRSDDSVAAHTPHRHVAFHSGIEYLSVNGNSPLTFDSFSQGRATLSWKLLLQEDGGMLIQNPSGKYLGYDSASDEIRQFALTDSRVVSWVTDEYIDQEYVIY